MNVLMFPRVRHDRNAPDPAFVTTDGDNRKLYRFALQYEMGAKSWASEIWAYSVQDAEERVAATPFTDDVRSTVRRGRSVKHEWRGDTACLKYDNLAAPYCDETLPSRDVVRFHWCVRARVPCGSHSSSSLSDP
ncbi:hypothetical protein AMK08_PB00090 (plasmid) [Rhizobium sp. N4311]|nr:hypothetical protein AMK08_PB00090 [Rhizobium sp. N4311]